MRLTVCCLLNAPMTVAVVQDGKCTAKIVRAVDYPLRLDMSKFSTHDALSDGWGPEYELGGLVLHWGSDRDSGHYTYAHKVCSGGWVMRDDDKEVLVVADPLDFKSGVVGLVYHRIPPPRSVHLLRYLVHS